MALLKHYTVTVGPVSYNHSPFNQKEFHSSKNTKVILCNVDGMVFIYILFKNYAKYEMLRYYFCIFPF